MPLSTDDIVEITQLYARYNTTIDSADGEGFAACFTPDGRLDTGGGPTVGTDALVAFVAATAEMVPGLRHQANNVLVDGDGDTATGSAFLVGYDVTGGYKVLVTGRYTDALTRTADGWRFTDRLFVAD